MELPAWETNSMMQDTREDVDPTLPAIRAANTYPWIQDIHPRSFVRVWLCGLWQRVREGEMFERSRREGRWGTFPFPRQHTSILLDMDWVRQSTASESR